LAVPRSAWSGDDTPSASPSSTVSAGAAVSAPVPASAPASASAPLDHKHFGRVARGLIPCEKCAAKAKAKKEAQAAQARAVAAQGHGPIPTEGMPEGSRIVGCAHSSHGVCKTCKQWLEMPGEVTVLAPGTPVTAVASSGTAPGRAVVSDAAPGRAVVAAGEPEPIGVMRTNYAATTPVAAARMPQATAVPVPANSGPYLGHDKDTSNPHVLGHLFGLSAWHRDIQNKLSEKERRRREKHAALSYEPADGKVTDLPASMVYGRQAPR
jgi:hypothetical protein